MSTVTSGLRGISFDVYMGALRQTFGGEPWVDIERYAEQVWAECREINDPDWEEIRDRVEAEWRVSS